MVAQALLRRATQGSDGSDRLIADSGFAIITYYIVLCTEELRHAERHAALCSTFQLWGRVPHQHQEGCGRCVEDKQIEDSDLAGHRR